MIEGYEYLTKEDLDKYAAGLEGLLIGISVFQMNIEKAIRYYQTTHMHEALDAVISLQFSFINVDIPANVEYIKGVSEEIHDRIGSK